LVREDKTKFVFSRAGENLLEALDGVLKDRVAFVNIEVIVAAIGFVRYCLARERRLLEFCGDQGADEAVRRKIAETDEKHKILAHDLGNVELRPFAFEHRSERGGFEEWTKAFGYGDVVLRLDGSSPLLFSLWRVGKDLIFSLRVVDEVLDVEKRASIFVRNFRIFIRVEEGAENSLQPRSAHRRVVQVENVEQLVGKDFAFSGAVVREEIYRYRVFSVEVDRAIDVLLRNPLRKGPYQVARRIDHANASAALDVAQDQSLDKRAFAIARISGDVDA